MGVFKKDKPEREPIPDKPNLVLEWDDVTAQPVYSLYKPEISFIHADWYWQKIADGDKAWAQKTAAHYGIEMPKKG